LIGTARALANQNSALLCLVANHDMPYSRKAENKSKGACFASDHVCSEGDVFEVEVAQLNGSSTRIKLNWECTLQCLRDAVGIAFDVPLSEQRLLAQMDGAAPNTFELTGSGFQSLLQLGVSDRMPITLLRQDPRTTSEKNCTLHSALLEHRMSDALEVIQSFGFPVDPNSVHHWRCSKAPCTSCGRDCLDIKERSEPCLALAVRARKRWNDKGEISGAGASEESVIPVVQELLKLRADVNGVAEEVHTQGSWIRGEAPDTKSALLLACQTGSPDLVQVLLEARADVDFVGGENRFGMESVTMMQAANGNSKIIDLLKAHVATPTTRVATPATRVATLTTPATRVATPATCVAIPATPATLLAKPATPATRVATPATHVVKPATRVATPATPATRVATPATPATRVATPATLLATPATPATRFPTTRTLVFTR